MFKLAVPLLSLVTLATSAVAHPGGHSASTAELTKRQEFQRIARRSLGNCASRLRARGGHAERAAARRAEFAKKVREERGLDSEHPFRKRDLATILATDHQSNRTDITVDSDASIVFDGNVSCVLASDGEVGPFYVAGEYIRSNLTEDQSGVPLYVDLDFIDVSICEPLSGVYVDLWNANATGVYAGVVSDGNGVGTADLSNINTTFLRGIQETNGDGFVQFETIVPGHYNGRTHHIHLVVHQTDGVVNDNGTYTGSSYTHHQQLFFDQDLLTEVNALDPYSANTGTLTTNEEDRVLADEADVDPILEYVLIGDSVSDGVIGWISLGINMSVSVEVDAAAVLTDDGGVANSTSSGVGGDGGAPSGSAFPSGSAPVSGSGLPSSSA